MATILPSGCIITFLTPGLLLESNFNYIKITLFPAGNPLTPPISLLGLIILLLLEGGHRQMDPCKCILQNWSTSHLSASTGFIYMVLSLVLLLSQLTLYTLRTWISAAPMDGHPGYKSR